MSEHTPGPWRLDHEHGSLIIRSNDAGLIADVMPWANSNEANARLIAAAPDMFRILKELLMPCPPEYAEATEQRIKALIEKVES